MANIVDLRPAGKVAESDSTVDFEDRLELLRADAANVRQAAEQLEKQLLLSHVKN